MSSKYKIHSQICGLWGGLYCIMHIVKQAAEHGGR